MKKTTISISIISLLIGGVLGSNYLTDNPEIDPITINPVSVNFVMAKGGDVNIEVKITGNATTKEQLIDAFAIIYDYQDEIEDEAGETIPNPETKDQFFNRMIVEYIQNVFNAGIKKQVETSAINTFENAKNEAGKINLKE